jgi:uncharacterized protein
LSVPVAVDLAPEPLKLIEPTLNGRVQVYDFIRGVAVLGILLANIPYFAGPGFSSFSTPSAGRDLIVESWTAALVAGKFRSMLAMLFGIGMWLQFEERSKVAGNWPLGYVKRMAFLALFGLIHWLLIWPGDILLIYSMGALAACWWVNRTDRFQRRAIAIVGAIALVFALSLMLITLSGGSIDEEPGKGGLTTAAEKAAFMSGSYFDQFAVRVQIFTEDILEWLLFLPFLAGLFFLGIQLGRYKVLERPSEAVTTRKRMLIAGFAFGIPLNLFCGWLLSQKGSIAPDIAVELCFGPLLSVGLIMLLALAAEKGVFRKAQEALAKVGRTAFSCYILQSLLCTAIFYDWGGGLYGKLDRLQMLAVVPAVWTVDLIFANLWLRRYQLGPLEWAWRSLTEGRRLPLSAN